MVEHLLYGITCQGASFIPACSPPTILPSIPESASNHLSKVFPAFVRSWERPSDHILGPTLPLNPFSSKLPMNSNKMRNFILFWKDQPYKLMIVLVKSCTPKTEIETEVEREYKLGMTTEITAAEEWSACSCPIMKVRIPSVTKARGLSDTRRPEDTYCLIYFLRKQNLNQIWNKANFWCNVYFRQNIRWINPSCCPFLRLLPKNNKLRAMEISWILIWL